MNCLLSASEGHFIAGFIEGEGHFGSIPTAMQFFRWRLVGAPATPTQATVYRLFPGGWPAVLEALEESSPGLMSTVPH